MRPAGRGRKLAASPAKLAAARLGIPVLEPERPARGLELGAPVVVAVAYGLIVPDDLLGDYLWLNVHPSLLPRWRGAAPVERSLMAGDEETGVTIIRLVHELDAGPIAAQESLPGRPATTTPASSTPALRRSQPRFSTRFSPIPLRAFRPQTGEPTYAAKIEAERPSARPRAALRRSS